jgi:hypothetical protein
MSQMDPGPALPRCPLNVCIAPKGATERTLENWRSIFDEVRETAAVIPKVGLMKLRPLVPDKHRYSVAVREGSDLPRGDRGWDPHASYHRNGTLHQKSFGHKFGSGRSAGLVRAGRMPGS